MHKTIIVDIDTYEKIKKAADDEERSISKMVKILVDKATQPAPQPVAMTPQYYPAQPAPTFEMPKTWADLEKMTPSELQQFEDSNRKKHEKEEEERKAHNAPILKKIEEKENELEELLENNPTQAEIKTMSEEIEQIKRELV